MRSLSNVGDFVPFDSFDVVLLHESFDVLLDIGDLGGEAGLHLLDDLLNKLDVLHLLARLHDADDGGLRDDVSMWGTTLRREIHTWSNNFRSSSIVLCVSSDSTFCSDLI